jgi:hypothetical protein
VSAKRTDDEDAASPAPSDTSAGMFDADPDTSVDVTRPKALLRPRPANEAAEAPEPEPSAREAPTVGRRQDPGDTMARAPLAQVRVREAIVRRNEELERSEVEARGEPPANSVSLVRIDWVRTLDRRLRVALIGRDTLEVSIVRRSSSPLPSAAPAPAPTLSIGLEGQLFTVSSASDADAVEIARCIARRLERHFEIDLGPGDARRARVRLLAPRR